MTEEKFCDQKDCPNFFYKEDAKPAQQTATQVLQDPKYFSKLMNSFGPSAQCNTDADIVNGNFPSDPRDGMKILDVKIPVECFVCSYLKRRDMKIEMRVSEARTALEGKQ